MPIDLHTVQRTFPKAFQGAYADVHKAMIQKLKYTCMDSEKLNGIRNGIMVLEEPFKRNFETTVTRNFYTLNEQGDLVCLKRKAIYHRNPSPEDRRSMSAKWTHTPKTHDMDSLNAISLDGKLISKQKVKERLSSNYPAGQFYFLPHHKMILFEEYDYRSGDYKKVIKDITGKRGIYGEHGTLVRKDGKFTDETVREGSFVYNENLGGVVSARTPKNPVRMWNFMDLLKSVYDGNITEAVQKFIG